MRAAVWHQSLERVRASATLPAGSTLWDVEGVPAAEIPTPDGGLDTRVFDVPAGRRFPGVSLLRNGAAAKPEDWDNLVYSGEKLAANPNPNVLNDVPTN
jgi:hypothetical protein